MFCLAFIVIIAYVSLQSIWSLMSVNEAFESFISRQYNTMKDLDSIAKDILQSRVNMLLEQDALERGDRALADQIARDTILLDGQYLRNWQRISVSLAGAENAALTEQWGRRSQETQRIGLEFHAAIRAGNLAASRAVMDRWVREFRELRDITYRLVENQTREGERIKTEMQARAQRVIGRSYALLAISIFLGFVLTFVLIRSFLNFLQKGVTLNTLISKEDIEKEVEPYQ